MSLHSNAERPALPNASMGALGTRPLSTFLVGICGAGMKALAEVLSAQGWKVAGSDSAGDGPTGQALKAKGILVFNGHSASQVPHELDVLIYSAAISPDNPERRTAAERGIPQYAYHEMLGQLMSHRIGISIAGTHGKSTTTALTGTILTSAGSNPTVLVGAEVKSFQANGWYGSGPHLVAESCEYRNHFLSLKPNFATILGIEPDHFDCFAGIEETAAAFRQFAHRIPANGVLILRHDCPFSRNIAESVSCNVETFGLTEHSSHGLLRETQSRHPAHQEELTSESSRLARANHGALPSGGSLSATDTGGLAGTSKSPPGKSASIPDWTVREIELTEAGHRFQIVHRGSLFCKAELHIPGYHHLVNVLAATALCHHAGLGPQQIAAGIAQFRGIRRRFEVLGLWRQVTVIDDYAHHPTAIRATLRTVRELYGSRRIISVFQPHQVSRTQGLLNEFATCFRDADEVLLVPVFGARETYQEELAQVSELLANLIRDQGTSARFHSSLDLTWTSLEDTVRPGDVLLTLGAGDIDRIHSSLHGLG